MYLSRQIEQTVLQASKSYPVVLVTGQRQVGKSTMLFNIKEVDRRYVTLDDLSARNLAMNDPELFFETYGNKLIIDEIQRVPSLFIQIKKIVDELELKGENNNGMFWLSGSQKFQIIKGVSDSLAGRIAILELSSLTLGELERTIKGPISFDLESLKNRENNKHNVNKLFECIFNGGMPKPLLNKIDRDSYYRDYINTYIERDVKDLSNIGKIDEFYNFLVLMAANTAQELRYDSISKTIGVSIPTVKSWVNILENSGIIFKLKPYFSNVTDRLIKTPKVYFMDTGLAAYLTRWPTYQTLESGNMSGAFFETYVVSEIIKNFYNYGKDINLYYYRDIDKKEIDLLQVDAESIYPIEIKKNKYPTNPDKNVSVLNKFGLEVKPMIVLCMSEEIKPLKKNVWLCPATKI